MKAEFGYRSSSESLLSDELLYPNGNKMSM